MNRSLFPFIHYYQPFGLVILQLTWFLVNSFDCIQGKLGEVLKIEITGKLKAGLSKCQHLTFVDVTFSLQIVQIGNFPRTTIQPSPEPNSASELLFSSIMIFILSQLISYLSIETLAPQHYLTIGSFGQWALWFQVLDFCRKFKYLSVVAILGIDQVGACSAPPAWPFTSLRDVCKFLPDSFILFHLLEIMFTGNNTVRTYWEILYAVVNMFPFACRGGFYCVALHWHPYSGFLLSLSLCLPLNTFSFFLLQVMICMKICI